MNKQLSKFLCRISVLVAVFVFSAALADQPQDHKTQPAPSTQTTQDESKLLEHGHYTNTDGKIIHSPAHTKDGAIPAGASAQCRDGTYSFSTHHRGTCSHHGGVAKWL